MQKVVITFERRDKYKDAEILNQVRYHHARELKVARLPGNSLHISPTLQIILQRRWIGEVRRTEKRDL